MLRLFTLFVASLSPLWGEVDRDGFRPLFNGKNLDGWVNVNCAPSTWSWKNGMLHCTGKPIGELRTERMYQNFILELEWRHLKPRGNAGVFVWADDITARGVPFHRGIEIQVLENAYGNTRSHTTHGDIFPIHGATMKPINGRGGKRAFPMENRSNPSPEWNHYRITCNDGKVTLAVNGKVVTRGTDCVPRKGYLCLESEGGIVNYRNVRIKELPDTPLLPEQVAIAYRGYRSLYNGVDLSGWNLSPKQQDHWEVKDWMLRSHQAATLATRESFQDFSFIIDLRLQEDSGAPQILLRGSRENVVTVNPADPKWAALLEKPGKWNRLEGVLHGVVLHLKINGQDLDELILTGSTEPGPLRLETAGPTDWANLYIRD